MIDFIKSEGCRENLVILRKSELRAFHQFEYISGILNILFQGLYTEIIQKRK